MTAIGKEKEYEKDGKKIKMIVMELDSEGLKLEITFFGDFVDQINNFVVFGEVYLLIVMVQYAKIKSFRGKIFLQNVMYEIRLLFNPDIPEAHSLKKSLIVPLDDNSQSLSIIPDCPYYSIEDDFLKCTARKSIEQLKDCTDDGFYIIFATVKAVNSGQRWWYTACKCNKDRDGCSILGKSCSDLLHATQKNEEPHGLPDLFGVRLIERSFLFKVEVKTAINSHYEPSFKVNRICNDESIIAKFKDTTTSILGAECDMTIGLSLGDASNSIDFQDVQSSATKDFTPLSDENVTLGCEADMNLLSNETPEKTNGNDVSLSPDCDYSSMKLKVKIEQQ